MDISSPEHAGAERVHAVRLDSVAPQPWRNGGGRTRELLAWPSADVWSLRISVAEIERDGPFSAFPGVERWFAVIDGAGVALSFGSAERICRRGDAPLAFDGGEAPGCRLLDGPTRDLNLMAKHGRAALRAVRADSGWDEEFAWRGLYAAVDGRWHDGIGSRTVDAGTLLWVNGIGAAGASRPLLRAAPWRFTPTTDADSAGDAWPAAWWIGYSPDPVSPP
jgi:environmental stress-induced protein Ves